MRREHPQPRVGGKAFRILSTRRGFRLSGHGIHAWEATRDELAWARELAELAASRDRKEPFAGRFSPRP